ncbi:MAG: hypothetical protein J3Q66DRAFT_385294 [Benniella sp.]|nr:MAG: hypothetical protein J3Q66DRAFT_385294 [Benniella sp.]
MDLPEIVSMVASFLGRSDLAAAALVCKNWNAIISSALYSSIKLSSSPTIRSPSKDGVMANIEYIQYLDLSFSVSASEFEYLYTIPHLCFPSLRKLRLDSTQHNLPIDRQLQIIRKCPALKDLIWLNRRFGSHQSYPSAEVCELFKTYCPFVERLDIGENSLKDNDLAQILDSCRRIKYFFVLPSSFGELAFGSLAKHYEHIQDLQLSGSSLTSKMAQAIMTNCPNLVRFWGVTLEAKDILGIPDENATGDHTLVQQAPREWVCTKVYLLSIFICGLETKSIDWHQKVFQQLARLDKLLFLVVGPGSSFRGQSGDGLDFRLEAGLSHLGSLKRLAVLDARGLVLPLDTKEAKWITETWPRGKVLSTKVRMT